MNHPLAPILAPRSVAVVGASRSPRKRGYQAVRTLVEGGFQGRVFPVNPKGGELLGLPVAASVAELDEPPDLAFICTPAESVSALLTECAEVGIRGAVISAVGFRESGEAGAALERDVMEVAHRTGIRVVGPNTSGILNTSLGLNLVGLRGVRRGRLAVLSQSGNVGLVLMNDLSARSEGVSVYVGVGNETDIAFDEYLEYLDTDPETAAILIYAEGFGNGRRFMRIARRISEHKPVVLLKGGRSENGMTAARSHTGAIAGSYAVLAAALKQAGVTEVLRTDELLSVGEALAAQPRFTGGTGVVVLSDGGGHATLAADCLTDLAVPLPPLAETTRAALRELLGPAAAVANPIDLAGAADGNPEVFARALELVVGDPATGCVLVVGLFGGYAIRFSEELAEAEARAAYRMAAIARETRVPLVVNTLYAGSPSEPLCRLSAAGVPVIESLEVAARCTQAIHERGVFLRHPPPDVEEPPAAKKSPPPIEAARGEGRAELLETEARELIAAHGAPVVDAVFCRGPEEVTQALETVGTPAVLKVVSPAIPHKTDAGGVALNIMDPRAASEAFWRIVASATAYAKGRGLDPDIRGVLVSPMLRPPVAELIVGIRRDSQFGPVLSVGAGGVAVEIFRDTAVRVLPVSSDEAQAMLQEIRLSPLLRGHRGRPAACADCLVRLIGAIAECAFTFPELAELEANPVFAYPDGAVAVDVRAFLNHLVR